MEFLILFCGILLCSVNFSYGQRRILMGEDAKESEFPYFAHGKACGATIIGDRWLLTAAHCAKSFQQGFGVSVGSIRYDGSDGTFYSVEKFIPHKEYFEDLYGTLNDIALVQLKKNIKFSNRIQSIKLPKDDMNTYVNEYVSAVGFGSIHASEARIPEILKFTLIRVTEQSKCKKYWPYVSEKNICTSVSSGKSTCKGDSGGPLVLDGTIVGIISYGIGMCGYIVPDVNTRVSSYLSWIEDNIRLHSHTML